MKREHLDFYGYNSPTSGRYFADGEIYSLGEDYRTVKRYREYMNAGFNILLLQHENSYGGEEFTGSACKRCMDAGYRAGIDKVIVSDTRLKELCKEKILVGENGRFGSEEEFCEYLAACVKPYMAHPAFYGVQLFDEPSFDMLESYAKVYSALKKLFPAMQMQCNLMNLCVPAILAKEPSDPLKDYENYLNYFIDKSGIDYLQTDEYPFRRNNTISNISIPTYQVLAKVCKERKVELRLVFQSFSQQGSVVENGVMEGGISWRRVTEKDMYWQLNMGMGFGCREFSFFTYFAKPFLSFKGKRCVTDGVDGAAFINYDGSRTRLYNYTRRIISEIKRFEKVLLKYEFCEAYFFFEKDKTAKDFEQTELALMPEKPCPLNVTVSKGAVLVTESFSVDGSRLYMVQNIRNTVEQFMYKQRASLAEIDLRESAGKAKFYFRGEEITLNSENGKVKRRMNCGDAIFIEING